MPKRPPPEDAPYTIRPHPAGVELCRVIKNACGYLEFKLDSVWPSERAALEEISRRAEERVRNKSLARVEDD